MAKSMLALITDEEIITMLEQLMDSDELFTNTPFLRRLREQGRREGRQEGVLSDTRRRILDALKLRFNLSAMDFRQMEQQLSTIDEETRLETLFTTAILANEIGVFQALLMEKH